MLYKITVGEYEILKSAESENIAIREYIQNCTDEEIRYMLDHKTKVERVG